MAKKTAKSKTKPKPRKVIDTTEKKLRNLKPFKSGDEWNGNAAGRPKGSRNKLCQRYIEDLQQVWLEMNAEGNGTGLDAIRAVAKARPAAFLTAVGNLVPREFDMGDKTQDAFREFLSSARNASAGPPNPYEGDDAQ